MRSKILVIENDQPILQLMEILLNNLGYEPVLVENGIDALQLVRKEPPALILLDLMMTPISGWDFLERLRSEPANKEIPVILFTASASVMERMAQMNDPRLGVLHKPVTLSELKRGIEEFLL
jgi:CheY-like chemotaxis protein